MEFGGTELRTAFLHAPRINDWLWGVLDPAGDCALGSRDACVLREPDSSGDGSCGDHHCTGAETPVDCPADCLTAWPDSDGDGLPDVRDLCPQLSAFDPRAVIAGANHADLDVASAVVFGDGVGDDCAALFGCDPCASQADGDVDMDEDGDFVLDNCDNCPDVPQPAPRLSCRSNCLEAPLPDSAWLLERGSIVGTLCRGTAASIADFFFAIGPGALPAARAFPSRPPLPADDLRWISLAEPIELLPEGRDLRLVGVSLDGARVVSQLVEGRFGFTPRGFFPGCPGGPNCPPQFVACAPGEACLFAAEDGATARAAPAPEPAAPVLVLSAARRELFIFVGGEARAIDLELGTRRTLEVGERPLGRVLAATYDLLRDRLLVLDEVLGRHGRARVRLVELDPSDGPADVLARWPRGAATTRFALTSARDGQLYLVASGERGQHALVSLSLDGHSGVRLTGLRIDDGTLASDRAYASDSGVSYVVARRGGLEVVSAEPGLRRWRGRAPAGWCF